MTQRATGVATYRNTDFFGLVEGLNFAAQYQGKNDRDNEVEANGDGFGLSATYEYEGFGVGAAYAKSDRTDRQVRNGTNGLYASGQNAEVWAAGLKYDANNIYLATTYSETLNMTTFGKIDGIANKTQNFEAVAQYQFDFGLRPSIAYLKSKGKIWVLTATRIWLSTSMSVLPTTSTKTCPPSLITKSTCWMTPTSLKMLRRSALTTSLLLV